MAAKAKPITKIFFLPNFSIALIARSEKIRVAESTELIEPIKNSCAPSFIARRVSTEPLRHDAPTTKTIVEMTA